ADGGPPKAPRGPPRPVGAVLAVGGPPPLEGPLAADAERRAGLHPVLDVDDVVDEEVVPGDLEGVAGGAGDRLPGEDHALLLAGVDLPVVGRLDRLRLGG